MIDSIVIDNFRLFRRLVLERLGRVNLIVGKNHSGKSTLLEALRLYASGADPDVLLDLVAMRQELQSERTSSLPGHGQANDLRHLFHGHRLPGIAEDGIILESPQEPEHRIHIRTAAYYRETVEGRPSWRRLEEPGDGTDVSADFEVFLVAEKPSGNHRLFILNENSDRWLQRSHVPLVRQVDGPRCPIHRVAVQSSNMDDLGSLWDATSLTDLENEVIAGLQLIEPEVRGLAFVENKGAPRDSRRVPLVRLKDVQEPLPLKSMGDGILRLFHIILALVNAKDGILLIDEAENGLHWSLQPKVWRLIFQLAVRLDVQIFATTHSKDCVSGFETAWGEHREAGAFFRLEAGAGGVGVTPYNSETLADSLETSVEIR